MRRRLAWGALSSYRRPHPVSCAAAAPPGPSAFICVHLRSSALSLSCFATNRSGATGSVGTAAARDDLPAQSYRGTMRLQASRGTSHDRARPRLIGPLGASVCICGCIILLCPAFGQQSSQSQRIGMAGPPRGGPVRCLISPRARIRRARSFRAGRHRRRSTACSATIWVKARDNLDEWIDRASERIIVAVDALGNT